MENYKTIQQEAIYEFSVKKSKFICYIKPVEAQAEAEQFIELINKRNYDATHNVPVYLIGKNYEVQKYSDDGEPSGTAGVPIIEMLKKEHITNVALVVTRYYGGIKLGTGGLVRAYSKAAKGGLKKAKILKKEAYQKISFKIDYTIHGKINNFLENKEGVIIENIDFLEFIEYKVFIKPDIFDRIKSKLIDFTSGTIKINDLGIHYISVNNK